MPYFSDRFQKTLYFTHHAIGRMKKRNIDFNLVLELIETGKSNTKKILNTLGFLSIMNNVRII
jgi:hypothetical protein